MADGLLLSKDLFFTTKVCDTATALNQSIAVISQIDQLIEHLPQQPKLILLDLENLSVPLDELLPSLDGLNVRTIAFGSHVNREQLQSARDAGIDMVMARSQFSAQLPQILQEHL